MRPSYLYNGNLYTGKTTSLYWDTPGSISPWRHFQTNLLDFLAKFPLKFDPHGSIEIHLVIVRVLGRHQIHDHPVCKWTDTSVS